MTMALKRTLQAVTATEDFPRGGGTSLTALEVKQTRLEGQREAEAELAGERPRKKIKYSKKNQISLGGRGEGQVKKEKENVKILHLSYHRLSFNSIILSLVTRIEPSRLRILLSFPGREMKGHITLKDQDQAKWFKVGELWPVKVLKVLEKEDGSGGGRVQVEIGDGNDLGKGDLVGGQVLVAHVKSIEEKGYVLSLPIDGITSFLPFSNSELEPESRVESKLEIGQPIRVIVSETPKKNSRTIKISPFLTSKISNHLNIKQPKLHHPPTIRSILPLSSVQAIVTHLDPNDHGILVKFGGKDSSNFWKGTIESVHLPKEIDDYKIGEKIDCRVLWRSEEVQGETRWMLSALKNLVSGKVELNGDHDYDENEKEKKRDEGEIVDVKVVRVEREWGIWVSILNSDKDENEKHERGWIHISHLSDDKLGVIDLSGPFGVGSTHRGRILNFSFLDSHYNLTLKPSLLSLSHFSLSNLLPSKSLKVIIKRVTPDCIFVDFGGQGDGVVFPNHYADVKLSFDKVGKKFVVGKKVKARVWNVIKGTGRVLLTFRKSLVDIDDQVEDNEETLTHLKRGCQRVGLIHQIVGNRGMVFESWGTKMWIGVKDMPKAISSYQQDTVQTAYIVSHDPITHKITASFLPPPPAPPERESKLSGIVTSIVPPNVVFSFPNLTGYTGLCSVTSLGGQNNVKVGETIKDLRVNVVNEDKRIVILKPPKIDGVTDKIQLTVGGKVNVRIVGTYPGGWRIQVIGKKHVKANMHWCEADDYDILKEEYQGEAIVVKIESDGKLQVSMRGIGIDKEVRDKEIKRIDDVIVGERLRGFVKGIGKGGVFVAIAKGLDARVQIKELCDEYLKDWEEKWEVGQLVKGQILSVDPQSNRIEMSFRTDPSNPKKQSNVKRISDFSVDQVVKGSIKKKEVYGMFVKIDGTKISGLCHKSQIPDEELEAYEEGEEVKARIVSVDEAKGRIGFSLLDVEQSDDDDEGEGNEDSDIAMDQEEEEQTKDDMEIDIPPVEEEKVAPLKVGRFKWTEGSDDDEEEEEEKDAVMDVVDNQDSIDPSITTESFERQIQATPHLANPWIKYLSYHVQQSQLPLARTVARRALEAIPFREQDEKLKVWLAWLNVEITSGGSDAEWEKILEEAEERCEEKKLWLGVVKCLERVGKLDKEEEIWKKLFAKYRTSSKVWTLFGQHLLNVGTPETKTEFQETLSKSLKSLPKHKHVKTIVAFGRMEFLSGASERGKTIFEGVLESFPKRLDVWKVYIDLERKVGHYDSTRNIFERLTKQKWSTKKSKFIFKMWLEFEKEIGDEKAVERVKQKAVEYVQNML